VPRAAPSGGSARARLLVADDNKVNRLLLCRSLELMGHDVASVDNGRSALEKLRAERYDLLLLDLEMPELDGFGLLEQRAADPALRDVPVIVTSSLEGVAAVARCIELGADDYLHKPVNPVLLRARVGATLERKHLRDRERELLARLVPDAASAGRRRARRGDRARGPAVRAWTRSLAGQPAADSARVARQLDCARDRGARRRRRASLSS
jgi:CheY-like chemotaxis protein